MAAKKKYTFDKIADSMSPLMEGLESFLKKQALSFESEVRDAAKECLVSRGKFIRPILAFAAAFNGNYDKLSLIRRAAISEMIHLSSLVHDDVIDEASIRRNCQTPNKKYGSKTAVLLGDAIFAHTMILAFEENDDAVSRKSTLAVKTLCQGEIKQTLRNPSQNVSRKKYTEIVRDKTAVLFALACYMGASACKPLDEKWSAAAEKAGEHLGIAYQIYDDICDWFMSEKDAGKTLGTDLASGKQTLPLILLLEKLPRSKSAEFLKNLQKMPIEEVSEKMHQFSVKEDCKAEFLKCVSSAENILKKFPSENAKLMEFCQTMRDLISMV